MRNFSVTDKDIIVAFPEFKIVNVNIKKTANGSSRGFGYVQLESVVRIYSYMADVIFQDLYDASIERTANSATFSFIF